MTNIVTNSDGSVTIQLQTQKREFVIIMPAPWILALLLVGLVVLAVWLIYKKKKRIPN
jgi:hypothetical protein